MKYILSFLLPFILPVSFYTLSYQTCEGSDASFSSLQGKKILIVNIATGSARKGQLAELQQLQQQHASDLVVIAFPSNSFGNEPRSNTEIKSFCQNSYGTTFSIAGKVNVVGENAHSVYKWLSSEQQNGDLDIGVSGDFQKYLVGADGRIIGVFGGASSPLDPKIISAIAQ